jgi:transcriptional regulator with XRE-family HTH domain
MNNRLREIIRYKTGGKQKDFAELIGCKPQYLAKLLRGSDFGLKPVLAVLTALPEINARWFLLGQGTMLYDEHRAIDLHNEALSHIQAVLDLDRFVPVMSPDEQAEYEQVIRGHKQPDFTPEARARWIERLNDHNQELDARIKEAMDKSDEICRQQIANE